jgi:hypothetical protein
MTHELSLKPLAGTRDGRLAFVFTNEGVNNLYLDNIRIVPGSSVEIKRGFEIFPNPLTNDERISIQFNLAELQDVVVQIIDPMGRLVFEEQKAAIQKQTDILNFGKLVSGVYTMRVITAGKNYTRKFVVTAN